MSPIRCTLFVGVVLLTLVLMHVSSSINTLQAQTIDRQVSVGEQRRSAEVQQPATFQPSRGTTRIPSPPATEMPAGHNHLSPSNQILRIPQEQRDSVVLTSHTAPDSSSKYEPIPLRIGTEPQAARDKRRTTSSRGEAATTVVTSLAVVLGAFFLLVWLARRSAPKGLAPLPGEVVESLGRAQLTARQQMQLIRLGRKLVLLSVTPTGTETITEVTDSVEVDRLCALCERTRSGSVTESFRQVLSQYASEPAPAGFVGDSSASQIELANRGGRRAEAGEYEDD